MAFLRSHRVDCIFAVGERALCKNDSCSVKFVDVRCDSRRRYFRHLGNDRSQQLVSAEFEMNVKPTNPTGRQMERCAFVYVQ